MKGTDKRRSAGRLRWSRLGTVALTAGCTLTLALALLAWPGGVARAVLLSARLTAPQGGREWLAGKTQSVARLFTSSAGLSASAAPSEAASTASSVVSAAAGVPASSQEASSAVSSASVPSAAASSASAPAGTRAVKTVQFGSLSGGDYELFQGICVHNETARHQPKISQYLAQKPDFALNLKSAPQVLILHTHTTESYAAADQSWYDPAVEARNPDRSRTVVRVGDEITKYLEQSGIGVLHDTAYHDYPEYEGAYDRELATIQSDLKKYPSIRVVLDVHRDSIQYSDGTRVKPTVTVDGKKAAQLMIEAPCDEPGLSPSVPDWEQNYRFGLRIQQQLVKDWPGLARPLDLRNRRYNMHMTHGSLLVEFGTDVNTLEEAVYAGELFGRSLAKTLLSLQ